MPSDDGSYDPETKMRQCKCGAYRLAAKVNGKWVWAGCRACDKIDRLEKLLEAGVKVTHGVK